MTIAPQALGAAELAGELLFPAREVDVLAAIQGPVQLPQQASDLLRVRAGPQAQELTGEAGQGAGLGGERAGGQMTTGLLLEAARPDGGVGFAVGAVQTGQEAAGGWQ